MGYLNMHGIFIVRHVHIYVLFIMLPPSVFGNSFIFFIILEIRCYDYEVYWWLQYLLVAWLKLFHLKNDDLCLWSWFNDPTVILNDEIVWFLFEDDLCSLYIWYYKFFLNVFPGGRLLTLIGGMTLVHLLIAPFSRIATSQRAFSLFHHVPSCFLCWCVIKSIILLEISAESITRITVRKNMKKLLDRN